MAPIVAVFSYMYHTKQIHGQPQPVIYLFMQDGVINDQPSTQASDKVQKQATAKITMHSFSTNICLKC